MQLIIREDFLLSLHGGDYCGTARSSSSELIKQSLGSSGK